MSVFSYKSIGVIIDHLEKKRRVEIEYFFQKAGVSGDFISELRAPSKLALLKKVFDHLLKRDERNTIKKIVEEALPQLYGTEREQLEKALLGDGFTVVNGILQAGPVEVAEEKRALQVLIERNPRLSREVLLHHLEQNQNLYTEGKWDASIGQGRNFIEQLLLDIANSMAENEGKTVDLSRPVRVRQYLVNCEFLENDERERLVDGIYGYLSEKGSHPGISQHSVARISKILCLAIGQYLIEKFDTLS